MRDAKEGKADKFSNRCDLNTGKGRTRMVPRFLTEVIVMPFMPLKRNRRVFLSLVREINESNKFSLSKIFTSYPCDVRLC